LCIRNPAQAARSLEQRDGLPADLGELRWYVYMAEIFRHLRNFPVCLIEYEEWFADAGDNLGKLARFLGLPQAKSAPAQSDIADRQLRHDDPSRGEAQLNLVRSLYELARRYEASAELDKALARAQQQEALREHAAALAAQQLAALREQLAAREATREPVATDPNQSTDNG